MEKGTSYITNGKSLGKLAKETAWLLDSLGNLETVLTGVIKDDHVEFNIPKKAFIIFNLGLSIDIFMCTKKEYPKKYYKFQPILSDEIIIDRKQLINTNLKKWCCIGDSITDKNNDTTKKRYYDYINRDNDYNVQVLGISGSGYARKKNTDEAFYQRIDKIDSDVDFVTVFGSFNDINYNSLGFGLGNIDDVGTETVCGCINQFFKNYFSRFPTTPIEIILPTPWEANFFGKKHSDDYVEALTTIAIRNGAVVLDLYRHSNLRPFDPTQKAIAFDEVGVHPNDKGHEIISGKIAKSLQSLFVT